MLQPRVRPNITNTKNDTAGREGPIPKILGFNVANIVICFAALLLNLAEVALILRKRQFKAFERVLLSLCVADIIVVLLYIIQKFYENDHGRPIYDIELQHLVNFPLEIFSVMSSITNIIVLGVDRLIAVKYPLKHGIWITTKKINILIAAAWIGSVALSVLANANRFAHPDVKSDDSKFTATRIFSGLLFSSGLIITVIYAAIIHTVVKRSKKMKKMQSSGGAERQSRSDEIPVTITCVLVVVAFTICSYPFAIDILINRTNPSIPFKPILLNALLDPLVYFFKGYLQRKLKNTKSNNQVETKLSSIGTDANQN